MTERIRLRVNGSDAEVAADPDASLLTVLAIVCAKETRNRDLTEIEPGAGRAPADSTALPADARSI